MLSNSVIFPCDSFLINVATSFDGFLLPFTYLQNADLLIPSLAANFECINHLLSKYSFNFINHHGNNC